jgi:hypothetical protein
MRVKALRRRTAVPELLYPEACMPSGVFLKKTPPFTELRGAREFWNRSKTPYTFYAAHRENTCEPPPLDRRTLG